MKKAFVFCLIVSLVKGGPLKERSPKSLGKRVPACTGGYTEPTECAGWIADCQSSSSYYQWMLDNCKVTCKVCEIQAVLTAPPTPPYLTAQVITFNTADCLKAHNDKRALHGVPNLQWDANLASQSAAWSLSLAQKSTVGLEHSVPNGAYGENLYYKTSYPAGTVYTCADAVKSWYDEIKDYNFNSPGFSSATGHFTQVVWKASTKVGVGIAAVTKSGWTYTLVTARYTPAGNIVGQFAENVPNLV